VFAYSQMEANVTNGHTTERNVRQPQKRLHHNRKGDPYGGKNCENDFQ